MTDSKPTKTLCTRCGHPEAAHDYVQHVLGSCTAFDHHNQESKSDAERYRWLRSHFEDVFAVNEDGDLVVQEKAIGNPELDGRNLDEAIDAAREEL